MWFVSRFHKLDREYSQHKYAPPNEPSPRSVASLSPASPIKIGAAHMHAQHKHRQHTHAAHHPDTHHCTPHSPSSTHSHAITLPPATPPPARLLASTLYLKQSPLKHNSLPNRTHTLTRYNSIHVSPLSHKLIIITLKLSSEISYTRAS